MTKRLYIETYGCQMNVLDSEMVVASLRKRGYELTQQPDSADAILFNTCSVRQHAEDKVYSSLGKLKQLKQAFPTKVIGVMGCMAQKDQESIFSRAPYVDMIVGPGQLRQVPDLIDRIQKGEGRQVELSLGRKEGAADEIRRSHETFDPLRDPTMRPTPWQAYVRIQIGCDKFCTYCIVPMVRGPEQGRSPEQIIDEAKLLADQGCLEITLLGQTVNSYRYVHGETTTRLSDLLYSLNEIDGLLRVKFVTSYPKDMTDDLLHAVRDLPKCSPYLHVPAQSGSNRVLERMKRGYTVEDYREMMHRIRETVPNYAVSSDFIIGFSGETEKDHQQSLDLVQDCRFKNSFIFKYSVRPGTKGAENLVDDVPRDIVSRRHTEMLELQNKISAEDNQVLIGQEFDVLVEGPSKAAMSRGDEGPMLQMVGRTSCDRIVVFDGNQRQAGKVLTVAIYDAHSHTLFGQVITQHIGPEVYSLA